MFDCWFLFSRVRQGVVAPAIGNLELRPAWWSPSRGSVGSDANGHTMGGPQQGDPVRSGSLFVCLGVCLRPKPGSLVLHTVRTDPCIAWVHAPSRTGFF